MTEPYYTDGTVTLYLGDCREILPALELQADLIVTDPPYGETSLKWDRWVDGWPTLTASYATSMWCFGSFRMFLDHADEFTAAGWRMSQDVVWEKNAGTGLANDRFRRVHEHALHWYRGNWREIHHDAQRRKHYGPDEGDVRGGRTRIPHYGGHRSSTWSDDGTRLVTSVLRAKNMRGRALAPTQKPVSVLDQLIRYGCADGGLVLDPFGGSASAAEAARGCGRRAVVIEADEAQIEKAARRLQQGVLDLGAAT